MTHIKAMKQALEALEDARLHIFLGDKHGVEANIRANYAYEALRQAIATEESSATQEPVAWEKIEAVAQERYKVVPSDASMFHRFAVVAGDGTRQLFIGREVECQNMARKFAGAFLDGAFVYQQINTRPQPAADIYNATSDDRLMKMPDEPVACLVETEQGVMVWPISDYDEASTYCDKDEFPTPLYTRPQPAAPQQSEDKKKENQMKECKHNWIESPWGEKFRKPLQYMFSCTRCSQARFVQLIGADNE